MRRAAWAGIAVGVLACVAASPAWAAPTTQVVQGDVLRLVSVADWTDAASMSEGHSVRWDVTVSADAPDPGMITIGVSATGDASLAVDARLCAQEWQGDACPNGAVLLRSGWEIPRDGVEVDLTEMADSEVAHVRLDVALAPGGAGGSTDIRVHARGQGEALTTGPDDDLATTGMSPVVPWILGGGALLVVLGCVLLAVRSRRRGDAASDDRAEGSAGGDESGPGGES